MTASGIIFANLYDSSLGELTNKRTMASLPYGGRYRQIDFALSNMANSGIRRIGVISRFNYHSLMNHIGSGEEWNLELQEGGLEFLTPYSMSTNGSYRGKLEALASAMDHLEFGKEEYVILADSSVLYNADLSKVLEAHVASGKDLTVMTKAGVANGSKQLDMAIRLDSKGNIADLAVDYAAPQEYVASMGLFIISRKLLIHHVKEAVARSLYRFERDFILRQYREGNLSIHVYQFEHVALSSDTTAEFFENNLALIEAEIRHDLFGGRHPIYTKVRDRVPTYYGEECVVDDCIVADGCMLEGEARHSVLFRQVTLAPGARVEDCVIMNDAVIGEGSELRYVILDKDVTIRPGTKLIGAPQHPIIIKRGEVV